MWFPGHSVLIILVVARIPNGTGPLVGNPALIISFVLAIPKERVTGAFSEIPIPDSCVFQL